MGDSVQVLQSDSAVQRLHASQTSGGKLRRGIAVAKPNTTIPSKYHTIVIDSSDRKGFMSTSKRFNYDLGSHVTPAANHYVPQENSVARDSPSYGRRGTGGFASRATRRTDADTGVLVGPGPAKYLPTASTAKSNFSRASASSSFAKPIAVQRESRPDDGSPAPNRYETLRSLAALRAKPRDLHAAFKAPARPSPAAGTSGPGPAAYDVAKADQIVSSSAKVPLSSFKTSSKRLGAKPLNDNPGPGEYHHEQRLAEARAANKQQFPMQHYQCLSAPALPLPPTPPQPGPGQYDIAQRPVSRRYMSSSMFLSSSTRWGGGNGQRADATPGPAHYQPVLPAKQKFSYNMDNHWAV